MVKRARPPAAGLPVDTTAHHNKVLPVSRYRDLRPWAFEIPQATERIFRANSHAPPPWRSRLAHSARLVEEEFALCGF